MPNSTKTLLLFTSSFPFGKGEQFIETELKFLAKEFAQVHIFPLDTKGVQREIPSNVIVMPFSLYAPYSRVGLLLRKGFLLLKWYNLQMRLTQHPDKYVGKRSHHFNFLMHRLSDAEKLGARLSHYDPENTKVYSYWFNIWAMALIFGKAAGFHSLEVITRAHGGDLDVQQRKAGYFPFRSLEMKMIDRIYSVSEYGQGLLQASYPSHAAKVRVSRLGVSDHGTNPLAEVQVFRIVSCSFVYGLKRIHLIIEILSRLDFVIEWVHFGDGELLDEIKEKAKGLPSNVTTNFKGLVSNAEVLEYYANNQVDLFMNVSELEGIPVSIMEAISFGIPVTGCRICGVPEIVGPETGILFEKEIDINEAVAWISSYAKLSLSDKRKFRTGVKQFWRSNYQAEVNYMAFVKEISKVGTIS